MHSWTRASSAASAGVRPRAVKERGGLRGAMA